jgi:hypothetical protein
VAERPEEVGPLVGALLTDRGRRDFHAASRRLPRAAALADAVAAIVEAADRHAARGAAR